MNKNRPKVYMTAGYNTISLGTGRKEFHPKKPRPGLEDYITEAGQGTLKQIGGGDNVDEGVIGNFMAARFNKQGNLAGLIPAIDEKLRWIPCTRVEGACGSGGLALTSAMKSIMAATADVVLTIGVEVQNTVKPIYGADILAGAGWFKGERKDGHAFFFPAKFSDRAGAYFKKYGRDKTRKAFARWYKNAIENARLCPTAQEYHNRTDDLVAMALTEPNAEAFLEHLTVFDCSKVSDDGSAIATVSEDGLDRIGIPKNKAVEIIGWGQVEADLTSPPNDLTRLETTERAVSRALKSANISKDDLAFVECHDCFTVTGLLSVEAIGFAGRGMGPDFILEGNVDRNGHVPFNTTGGLVGWGHPTGGTGVRQAVTVWEQLTGNAGDWQVDIPSDRPYALSINMGGNDITVIAVIYRQG